MATFKVVDVTPVSSSSSDYHIAIEVDGEAKELFARRVRYEGDMPVIGEFEPVRTFRDLPLDVHQLHELMRVVVAVHFGGSPPFPVLLNPRRA